MGGLCDAIARTSRLPVWPGSVIRVPKKKRRLARVTFPLNKKTLCGMTVPGRVFNASMPVM
jgi:hypothetical protein